MLKSFAEVLSRAQSLKGITISVAAAQDKEVLQAVKSVYEAGFAKAILVGDAPRIKAYLADLAMPGNIQIIDKPDEKEAARTAAFLVKSGEAQLLMKGLVNSSIFLKAVLDHEVGLRTGRLLCHLAAYEVPGRGRIEFHSDGGMNVLPTLDEKRDILINSLLTLGALGIESPNVAVLTANEVVSPKMPATMDAQALVEMKDELPLRGGVIEGPIALDVAVSPEAAKHKGIDSKISGKVDLFIVPNIEAGNILGKSLIYAAKAKSAGIIIGAAKPVVMTSRSDTPEAKLHSIALACLAA